MWDEVSARFEGALRDAARRAQEAGDLPAGEIAEAVFTVEEPRERTHGDLAANLALVLARPLRQNPRAIAAAIARHFHGEDAFVSRLEVAGAGFLNAFLDDRWPVEALRRILAAPDRYGLEPVRSDRPGVLVEFVSANPVGPLNVVSGRAAVLGDVLANLFEARGHRTSREYYVNDSGGQAVLFGQSLLVRAREIARDRGADVEPGDLPKQGYRSEDLIPVAGALLEAIPEAGLPPGDPQAEAALATKAARFGMDRILDGVRESLLRYGVRFDGFVSEQKDIRDAGRLEAMLRHLRTVTVPGEDGTLVPCLFEVSREPGLDGGPAGTWEEDDEGGDAEAGAPIADTDGTATLLRTQFYGDDKPRVLVKSNGQMSYFAADIAYHAYKYERGFDLLVDLIGPDHHGYLPRMMAAMQILGHRPESLEMRVVQLVRLLRGGEPVRMSKRRGDYVTLDELLDEVGADATRFFLLSRHMNSPLDFDLDLARSQIDENPVFYVQYAHARIRSILRRAAEAGQGPRDQGYAGADLSLLASPEERNLIRLLAQFPMEVRLAAELREPHRLTRYALELASRFHTFYNRHRVLGVEAPLSEARMALVECVAIGLRRTLGLMGVSAPDRMDREREETGTGAADPDGAV